LGNVIVFVSTSSTKCEYELGSGIRFGIAQSLNGYLLWEFGIYPFGSAIAGDMAIRHEPRIEDQRTEGRRASF
jgi:hypothetical protein